MKKVLFVLFVSLIGFGAKTYSQTTVTLDSIVNRNYALAYTQTFLFYSSYNDVTPSTIIEKGIFLETVYPNGIIAVSDRIHYPDSVVNYSFIENSLFIPIYNQDFDTVLHFGATGNNISVYSYIITNNDTILSDSTLILEIRLIGLDEILNTNLDIKLFPSIIDKEVNISSDKYPVNLCIIDLFGREVLYKKIHNSTSLDLGFLKKGIYISKFRYKDSIVTRKLIKN